MKLKLLRANTTLKADGKTLAFDNGICNIEKITKNIQSLVDNGYIQIIKEELKDGDATNK